MKYWTLIILVALSVFLQSCGPKPKLYECINEEWTKFGMSLTESELKLFNKIYLFDKELGVLRYYNAGDPERKAVFDTVANILYANLYERTETFSCNEVTK
jgi:hypothetical protein